MTGSTTTHPTGLQTEAEVASSLGVCKATLQIWRRSGRGPAFTKLGKSILYDPADVDTYLKSLRQQPAATTTAVGLASNDASEEARETAAA